MDTRHTQSDRTMTQPYSTTRSHIASSSQNDCLRILFVGAGAIGCFYASRLHHPSHNIHVSLVCRSNYEIVSKKGVWLETRDFGKYNFTPSAVFPSVAAAASFGSAIETGWDYIILTTKALPDIENGAEMTKPLIQPEGRLHRHSCIVLIQNGVGIEQPYRDAFPQNPLVSGVTAVSAEQVSDGVVRQNRWTRLELGPYTNGAVGVPNEMRDVRIRGQKCTETLCSLFREYGGIIDAKSHDEIEMQHIRWHKLSINAAMNPTSILCGGRTPSDMVSDTDLKDHLKAIMIEVREAAAAVLGTPMPDDLATPDRILDSVKRNLAGRPSMWVDWLNNKPMELEVILGLPSKMAARAGYNMDRVHTSYVLLKSAQLLKQRLHMNR